ncbi:MAG: phosphatidylglycerophosphatase A [Rhodospirillales bacterium]|nr:phosphatidylglycerophosphatase A [Rhodospirillales bacterium]
MAILTPLPAGVNMWRPSVLLATWFGAGLLPKAPGTWGSLAALPFAWVLAAVAGPAGLGIALAAVVIAGLWSASVFARASGEKDCRQIVIDEVAGQWLTLLATPPDVLSYALGFALFRIADVFKPWPVSWADRAFKGGLGVMLDDLLAGAYAFLVLFVLSHWIGL